MPLKGLNIYHQDKHLLFQCILSEFLQCYQETLKLEALSNNLISHTDQILKDCVVKLVGSNFKKIQNTVWHHVEGVLFQFRNYCLYFSQLEGLDNKSASQLQLYAHQAYLLCLQCFESISAMEGDSQKLKAKYQANLTLHLKKIHKCMQRIERTLLRIVYCFRKDENIIFFMIRHHVQYETLFGAEYLPNFLKKCFPRGLQQVNQHLADRYLQRGFDHLIPFISSKISEIEAATL
jgi:hypothetical protein